MGEREPELIDIYGARRSLHGRVRPTPLVHSLTLSEATGVEIRLKLEHHQITGAFKLRGATRAILGLDETQRAAGVVGVSTGNFGRGLAYAAREAGVQCVICMSRLVPQNKVDAIRSLGAEVRIVGDSQDQAQLEVDKLQADHGMIVLDPFDHPDVIAGQGTLGLELIESWPQLETVVVPLSGGGLIAGIALAVKSIKPGVRVIGVSMERGAAMYQSIRAGRLEMVAEVPSLADSLGGGIGLSNRYTFSMVQKLVDDIVLVSENEIAAAIRHAYWHERQIIEGAGAVGIAALLAGRITPAGDTVVVLSGGNIELGLHHRIIGGEDVDAADLG